MIDEIRFRATLFTDCWVEDQGTDEANKQEATRIAEEFASLRPNTYVGSVDPWGSWTEKIMGVKPSA